MNRRWRCTQGLRIWGGQASLLTAAAKASVDIAKAITIVDNQVMKKWLLAVPDQNVERVSVNAASRAKEIEILASSADME